MNKLIRTIAFAALATVALATTSPLYALQKAKPSMSHDMMTQSGMMDGKHMMAMMQKMNKMMDLCTKMMESKMDGGAMKQPMTPLKKMK